MNAITLALNPRYVAYASAHRRDVTLQLSIDRLKDPEWPLAGFHRWLTGHLAGFRQSHPAGKLRTGAWTRYLQERAVEERRLAGLRLLDEIREAEDRHLARLRREWKESQDSA